MYVWKSLALCDIKYVRLLYLGSYAISSLSKHLQDFEVVRWLNSCNLAMAWGAHSIL